MALSALLSDFFKTGSICCGFIWCDFSEIDLSGGWWVKYLGKNMVGTT